MNNNELPSGELIVRYKEDMLNILQKLCPKLDLIDLEEGINYSISRTCYGCICCFHLHRSWNEKSDT